MAGFSGSIGSLWVEIGARIDDFKSKMRQMSDDIGEAVGRAKEHISGLDIGKGLAGIGLALSSGITAGMVAIGKAAVEASTTLESLTMGLTAVTGSGAKAQEQLGRLKDVAKLPGLGFEEAVRGSINLQAAGFSAIQAENSLKGFGNALATVGKGKADLDGVIKALSDIASKGAISAEEIHQLAERVPQIRQIMIKAFGTADTKILQGREIGATEFVDKVSAELLKLPLVTGGIRNSFENLTDKMNQTFAGIGNQLAPFVGKIASVLEGVLDWVQKAITWFGNLPEPVKNGAIAFAAMAAALGPLLVIVGGGIAAFSSFVALFAEGGLLVGLGVTAGGFTAVAAAIPLVLAALVALGTWVYSNWAPIVAVLSQAWEGLNEAWNAVWGKITGWLVGIWTGIGNQLKAEWDVISTTAARVWNPIAEFFGSLWNGVEGYFASAWASITQTLTSAWAAISAGIESTWEPTSAFFASLWNGVEDYFSNAWGDISTALTDSWNSITNTVSAIWGPTSRFFETLWDSTASYFLAAWDGVSDTLISAWETIGASAQTVWKPTTDFFATLWASVGAYFSAAWESIGKALSASWTSIAAPVKGVWDPIAQYFRTLWEGVSDYFSASWGNISSILTSSWEGIAASSESIWGTTTTFFGTLWKDVGGYFASAWGAIATVLTNAWNGIAATVTSIWTPITILFGSLWEGVDDSFRASWATITNTLTSAWDTIATIVETLWEPPTTFFSSVWDGIQSYFSTSWANITKTLIAAWNAISDPVRTIWEPISKFFGSIWDGVEAYFSTAWSAIARSLTGVWEGIKGVAVTVWGKISDAISTFLDWAAKIPGVNKLLNLDEAWASAKKAGDELKKTSTTIDNLKKSAEGAAGPKKKLGEAIKGAGDAAKEAEFKFKPLAYQNELLAAGAKLNEAAHKKLGDEIVAAKAKMAEWGEAIDHVIGPSDTLTASIDLMVGSMQSVSKGAVPAAVAGLNSLKGTTADLEAAFKTLGVTSATQYQDIADAATAAYEVIAGSGVATPTEENNAMLAMLKAQRDAMVANGETIPAEFEEMLGAMDTAAKGAKGLPRIESSFEDFRQDISGIVSNMSQDMIHGLFEGDLSFAQKGMNALKSLGEATITFFTKPFTDAANDLMSGVITDLLGGKGFGGLTDKIKEVGEGLKGLFGGGSDAISGGADKIPGAAAPGGAPGAAGQAAGAGLTAIVGAVGSVVGAVSGIIGNFQNARQENTLNAIEESTRYTKIFAGEGEWSILQNTGKSREFLGYLVGTADAISLKLNNWLEPLQGKLNDIFARVDFSVMRLGEVSENTYWGSVSDRDNTSVLNQMLAELRIMSQKPMVVNVYVDGQKQASKSDADLRMQGVLAL